MTLGAWSTAPSPNKDGTEGEFKVYGRAVAVDDPSTRARYCFELRAATGVGTRG